MGVPASTIGTGSCFAMPDTCNTPTPAGPVPVPYPNTGENAMPMLPTAALNVMIGGKNAMMEQSQIMLTNGDNAGVNGGVMSGTFMGPAQFKLGSTRVMANGRGLAYLGSLVGHNNPSTSNAPAGAQIVLSQPTVLTGP